MRYYPVGLDLSGKQVLVIGAGRVAERKVRALLSFGARVKVVAPLATEGLRKLSEKKEIRLFKRRYVPSDIRGARLVIAASSDKLTNERAAISARKRDIWVNVVDQAGACDFISTAIIRKRGIVISVSTDGKWPALSRDLKNFLKENWDAFLSYRDRP